MSTRKLSSLVCVLCSLPLKFVVLPSLLHSIIKYHYTGLYNLIATSYFRLIVMSFLMGSISFCWPKDILSTLDVPQDTLALS